MRTFRFFLWSRCLEPCTRAVCVSLWLLSVFTWRSSGECLRPNDAQIYNLNCRDCSQCTYSTEFTLWWRGHHEPDRNTVTYTRRPAVANNDNVFSVNVRATGRHSTPPSRRTQVGTVSLPTTGTCVRLSEEGWYLPLHHYSRRLAHCPSGSVLIEVRRSQTSGICSDHFQRSSNSTVSE